MNIVYRERLVAFIDVLGFKNLVHNKSSAPIEAYYNFLLLNFKAAVAKRNFEFLLISDSIVIYSDDSAEDLCELIKMINLTQAGLLSKGILVRGAISHGDLFVDPGNNIVVGRGLINAYQLEMLAKFPRVILDRSLVAKHYGSTSSALAKNNINELPHLSQAQCNGHVVDYLYLNYGRLLSTSTSHTPYKAALALLKENYYKNEHTEKFEWLKAYLTSCLVDQKAHVLAQPYLNNNSKKRLRLLEMYIPEFHTLEA
ncbi:hypothetical protein [Stenotrophomonas sp. NRRL B-14846]|uniref:hypothetical protein n=1 Tax=Stenotrophomonas sp. NRRL B-14846 TaxID=3162882 RepID=UPI00131108F4|nr:hypothetical protein [Stenotrophomonas maltophilia]